MDRISELPETLRHHILSFLPLKQVAQTSVLSKTWEQTWHTYPFLDFAGPKILEMVCDIVEQAVRYRCQKMLNIERFSMLTRGSDDPKFHSLLDQCIYNLIKCNVKELKLRLCELNPDPRWYDLPEMVLCAKSIQLLELKGCKLEYSQPIIRSNAVFNLSSLRKFYLYSVYVNGCVLKNILDRSPFIEELVLINCHGLKHLEIAPKLNTLAIKDNRELESVEIEEPLRLNDVSIMGSFVPEKLNLAAFKNLKKLKLTTIFLKKSCKNFCGLLSELSVLEELEIDCVHHHELRCLDISSASLKRLHISNAFEGKEMKINTPNLDMLEYSGYAILLSSLNEPLRLRKAGLKLRPYGEIGCGKREWYLRFFQLIANFRHSHVLCLQFQHETNIGRLQEARQVLPSPLLGVKHLEYNMFLQPMQIKEYLDNLIWISPHVSKLSVEYQTRSGSLLKLSFSFLYKEELNYEDWETPSCCKSVPVLCWEHCINQVKLEITKYGFHQRKKIPNYSFKGDNILASIESRLFYIHEFLEVIMDRI